MSFCICLAAGTLGYPEGGGHLWVYLNWALSLRALGCRVLWLETISSAEPVAKLQAHILALKERLQPYGLAESLVLCPIGNGLQPEGLAATCLDSGLAATADLLINLYYELPAAIVKWFRRSALLDIDPGLLQNWISKKQIQVAPHDLYFTIGETVGRPGSHFPDAGLKWHYTPPCVVLERWPITPAPEQTPFTTVTHWYADEWMEKEGEIYCNNKRSGFLPFLDLPRYTTHPLELALCLGEGESEEQAALLQRGWRLKNTAAVASTPWDYQHYIQNSKGEFSCCKPSCVRLQNAWISDRTLCYLASGKPAVVQHTGPSHFLPTDSGLFRFYDLPEAVKYLEQVIADYEQQCKQARALAEEYFDGRKIARRLLESLL